MHEQKLECFCYPQDHLKNGVQSRTGNSRLIHVHTLVVAFPCFAILAAKWWMTNMNMRIPRTFKLNKIIMKDILSAEKASLVDELDLFLKTTRNIRININFYYLVCSAEKVWSRYINYSGVSRQRGNYGVCPSLQCCWYVVIVVIARCPDADTATAVQRLGPHYALHCHCTLHHGY